MKKLLVIFSCFALVVGCGTGAGSDDSVNPGVTPGAGTKTETKTASGNPSYDPDRGQGKFNNDNVKVGETLDAAMASSGDKIYAVKCGSCHKLSDEKLVGPGWKDVTKRHTAAWIMNFITNTDEMLDKDPKAQAQLEICLVRMPNQNLSDQEARDLYEFMRKNDGVK
ncbi:MAG: cytochrome c [Chitinophagaceae bacterium]|nr:cytochrome c [Bacteroidota bacterium]MCC6257960.1 cytochrome c [Chitinophagaceae bacterium]MCW5917935.1 cytochrome c [Ferruginibacter sp.]